MAGISPEERAEIVHNAVPGDEQPLATAFGTGNTGLIGRQVLVVLSDRRLRIVKRKDRNLVFDVAAEDLIVHRASTAVNNAYKVNFCGGGKTMTVQFTAYGAGASRGQLAPDTADLLHRVEAQTS